MIEVIESGIMTTVQDSGRYGHYHIGMPPSGAMDQFAHQVANYLLGNDPDVATLEMTYLGCDLKFNEDTVIAITGADMSPEVNGEAVPMWTAIQIESGDRLTLEYSTDGVRSYLAVAGGIDVDVVMNSRSTYTLIGMGGYQGRKLQEGDRLKIGEASEREEYIDSTVANEYIPDYGDNSDIRVVMGLCDYRLTDNGREEFLEADWKVSDEANRVGYRFEGPDIESMFEERDLPFGAGTDITNVVDVGYPVGSIQMAGQPIIPMRDAVTGGGYATIGTVISPDRSRLAQRRTHQTVEFSSVTVEEAIESRKKRKQTLQAVRNSIR